MSTVIQTYTQEDVFNTFCETFVFEGEWDYSVPLHKRWDYIQDFCLELYLVIALRLKHHYPPFMHKNQYNKAVIDLATWIVCVLDQKFYSEDYDLN